MQLGIENLLNDLSSIVSPGERIGFLGHPASLTQELEPVLDLLADRANVTCVFGPQHGFIGEKQDNMIESDHAIHAKFNIPVYSLYGETRRIPEKSFEKFDTLIFDLQDVGCRIYTYITTLFYVLEDCSKFGRKVIVCDRPNPAGRAVEGFTLEPGHESFVGGAELPMRHGLTLAELASWYVSTKSIDVNLQLIKMDEYVFSEPWPAHLVWVNPSPNMSSLNCARQYAGSVLLEGTSLSEGRGTTVPLEVIGHPKLDFVALFECLQQEYPEEWLAACKIRPCFFQPTFHKHSGEVCNGLQVHCEGEFYAEDEFKPFRLYSALLKLAFHQGGLGSALWTKPPYEYEFQRVPIDVINGGKKLREWIENTDMNPQVFEENLQKDEQAWVENRAQFLLYQ